MHEDSTGFRLNVGIVLINQQEDVFWGQRIQKDSWQFPQGGIDENEAAIEGMYRELYEEVGLTSDDVTILAESKMWYSYRLPTQFLRKTTPKILGQKQKWFLLKLISDDNQISLDSTLCPEFTDWIWVDYWYPIKNVIFFKKKVYRQVLEEFDKFLSAQK